MPAEDGQLGGEVLDLGSLCGTSSRTLTPSSPVPPRECLWLSSRLG